MRRHTFYTLLITTIAFLFACTSSFASTPPPIHKPIKGFHIGMSSEAAFSKLKEHLDALKFYYPDAYIDGSRISGNRLRAFIILTKDKNTKPLSDSDFRTIVAGDITILLGDTRRDDSLIGFSFNPSMFNIIHRDIRADELEEFAVKFNTAYDIVTPHSDPRSLRGTLKIPKHLIKGEYIVDIDIESPVFVNIMHYAFPKPTFN